jgi:TusA-related sulfurtransferase
MYRLLKDITEGRGTEADITSLEELAEGQVLEVLLNEESAQNVPASAAAEGHEVVSVKQEGDHWRVSLRKAAVGRR